MHTDDPVESIMHLLRDEWEPDNTHGVTPRTHTGWFDFGAGGQQVTVTNPREDPVGGGDTGWTAVGPGGRGVQLRVGSLDVNCWPGTREDTASIDGGVNPKALSHAMKNEVVRIIADHDHGVIDGDPVFNSLAPTSTQRIPDQEGASTIYRWLIETRYTYHATRTDETE